MREAGPSKCFESPACCALTTLLVQVDGKPLPLQTIAINHCDIPEVLFRIHKLQKQAEAYKRLLNIDSNTQEGMAEKGSKQIEVWEAAAQE